MGKRGLDKNDKKDKNQDKWLGDRDSNPDKQFQRLLSCR